MLWAYTFLKVRATVEDKTRQELDAILANHRPVSSVLIDIFIDRELYIYTKVSPLSGPRTECLRVGNRTRWLAFDKLNESCWGRCKGASFRAFKGVTERRVRRTV